MKIRNRKPANGKGFKKQFTRSAKKINGKNLVKSMRGGYRL